MSFSEVQTYAVCVILWLVRIILCSLRLIPFELKYILNFRALFYHHFADRPTLIMAINIITYSKFFTPYLRIYKDKCGLLKQFLILSSLGEASDDTEEEKNKPRLEYTILCIVPSNVPYENRYYCLLKLCLTLYRSASIVLAKRPFTHSLST